MKKKPTPCPCGRPATFDACCGPVLAGERSADTPETLMRSRYTAFTRGDATYLLASWHPDTRPDSLSLNDEPPMRWLGLTIASAPPTDGDVGTVTFIARYRSGGRAGQIRERSRFRRQNGRWFYVDGEFQDD
ncbi:YchJ family protein [Denitromonas halophila]|uniref:UPF0225 protein FHP91_06740 n=1 Tax=Denitromonas halophila TaxID=1629404 RepID=A0A557QYV5_9RHOO|nr:YchJ family metal-binding protein [Denitromonas halophila]TVO58087.1 hypothetical protein FHP91_06740 [Denitromonas halophila]